MGLFDRLLNNVTKGSENAKPIQPRSPKKEAPEAYFLDADSSSSLGDVDYMRESKTIRRTFPGTADSPGTKERVVEVAAETGQLTKRTDGLGGGVKTETSVNLTDGIPKPVKKTFAAQMSSAEMKQRLKGTAISGVNAPMPANASLVGRKEELKPTEAEETSTTISPSSKAGSIDPFRQMVRDLNK